MHRGLAHERAAFAHEINRLECNRRDWCELPSTAFVVYDVMVH